MNFSEWVTMEIQRLEEAIEKESNLDRVEGLLERHAEAKAIAFAYKKHFSRQQKIEDDSVHVALEEAYER